METSAATAGNDQSGKSGWREILAQIEARKTQEYCMYFKFFGQKVGAKDPASADDGLVVDCVRGRKWKYTVLW